MGLQCVKVCDQCSAKFFVTGQPQSQCRRVVADREDAHFCSPYCQALWLADQFAAIEKTVYDSDDDEKNGGSNVQEFIRERIAHGGIVPPFNSDNEEEDN